MSVLYAGVSVSHDNLFYYKYGVENTAPVHPSSHVVSDESIATSTDLTRKCNPR